MTQGANWGAEEWRQPTHAITDTVLFSECGRVINSTCYRSFWIKIVKSELGGLFLLIKHGGGEERIPLYYNSLPFQCLESLDSDSRYLLLFTIYKAISDGKREAKQEATNRIFSAFCDGRLKKLKRNHRYHMEIQEATC